MPLTFVHVPKAPTTCNQHTSPPSTGGGGAGGPGGRGGCCSSTAAGEEPSSDALDSVADPIPFCSSCAASLSRRNACVGLLRAAELVALLGSVVFLFRDNCSLGATSVSRTCGADWAAPDSCRSGCGMEWRSDTGRSPMCTAVFVKSFVPTWRNPWNLGHLDVAGVCSVSYVIRCCKSSWP